MININQSRKNNEKKINEKERKYNKITIKFKKRDNSKKRKYRSLTLERDKRKLIQSINYNEEHNSSLTNLNSKLNSLIDNFNNLQSLNLNLKYSKKFSSSMIELNLSKCDKLINKIRSQKKIREMFYDY